MLADPHPDAAAGSVVRSVELAYAPRSAASLIAGLRHGGHDPTQARTPDGAAWRTCRTPDGPVTLRLSVRGRTATGQAWGPGAHWQAERLPALVGADDPTLAAFQPGRLADAARRCHGPALGRTGLVWDSLLPAIIEQKVTGLEAFAGYRRLLRRYGEPAPGPGELLGMITPPDPRVWMQVPGHEFHQSRVGPQRRDTVRAAASAADGLQRLVDGGRAGQASVCLDRELRRLNGVGVWTSAEVRQRVLGDPDAVSVGDAHLSHVVGTALVGRRVDDAGMLRLLAPWRGHRHRVCVLLMHAGAHAPRFGPRYTPHDFRGM